MTNTPVSNTAKSNRDLATFIMKQSSFFKLPNEVTSFSSYMVEILRDQHGFSASYLIRCWVDNHGEYHDLMYRDGFGSPKTLWERDAKLGDISDDAQPLAIPDDLVNPVIQTSERLVYTFFPEIDAFKARPAVVGHIVDVCHFDKVSDIVGTHSKLEHRHVVKALKEAYEEQALYPSYKGGHISTVTIFKPEEDMENAFWREDTSPNASIDELRSAMSHKLSVDLAFHDHKVFSKKTGGFDLRNVAILSKDNQKLEDAIAISTMQLIVPVS